MPIELQVALASGFALIGSAGVTGYFALKTTRVAHRVDELENKLKQCCRELQKLKDAET